MNKKETVCAVVVTYNRKDLLIECLDALLKQTRPVQGVYIIDNFSNDGTPELLLEKGYIKKLPPENIKESYEMEFELKKDLKVFYVRMHENTGGAGGFYEGVKRGYERGYDWLWLMDDDAEPKEDALEKLSLYFHNEQLVGLASKVVLKNGRIAHSHRGKVYSINIFSKIQKPLKIKEYKKPNVEIDIVSFVGFLVSKSVISYIGFPKKEFFIHNDDVEYSLRIRKNGKIFLVTNSTIIHKEKFKEELQRKIVFLKKGNRTNFNSYWLAYYGLRNLIYIRKTEFGLATAIISSIFIFSRQLAGIILFDDNKLKRIKFVLSAFCDGMKGVFDNEKPKKILYS